MTASSESVACDAVLDIVAQKMAEHPRSLQVALGVSEVGHPCPRWVAYKLAATSERAQLPAWRPAVGTAVHAMLGEWLMEYEEAHPDTWLCDLRVEVGMISPGSFLRGTLDAYHIPSKTIVDFKIPGPSAMKKFRGDATPESPQYRTQIHSYGYGARKMGLEVERVAILRLPAAGEFSDAIIKEEPYDETIAINALRRAQTIAGLIAAGGRATFAVLPMVDHYCTRCPYYKPGSVDPTVGCPGVVKQFKPDATAGGLLDV